MLALQTGEPVNANVQLQLHVRHGGASSHLAYHDLARRGAYDDDLLRELGAYDGGLHLPCALQAWIRPFLDLLHSRDARAYPLPSPCLRE